MNHTHDFKKIIQSFHHHHTYQLFTDWLEIAACAIHQEPYHLGFLPHDQDFATVEAHYMTAVKKYKREELDAFAKLLAITKLALWQEKTDFLGQLYMSLEISNNRSGEFFTPYELSLMTARMILGDLSAHIQDKGFITLAEPACGAGGMIIAAAHIIEEQGHDPSKTMFFDATDISRTCYNMTYLQCSILGLSGYVRHANSLSLEQWDGRFTPICRVYPWRTQKFLASLKQTDNPASPPPPDQPNNHPLPPGGLGRGEPLQQTTLFDFTPAPITPPIRKPTKQPQLTHDHELAQVSLF